MPFRIAQGNVAEFIISFLDASGNLTPATGAIFTVTYTNTSGSTAQFSFPLSHPDTQNFFHTVSWNSAVAAVGKAQYAITFGGANIAVSDPNLRITSPSIVY
jgi:hypothetical protein